jgi:REP element-mobilizing transposase RayT
MPEPIVIAYHLIWTAYGTWLPNDPRGSGSKSVHRKLLAELGELHYGRRAIQPAQAVVREFYEEAEGRLQFPVLHYSETQRELIGAGLREGMSAHRYTCYACAVMPDHVHLLIRKHKHQVEEMIENLQDASRSRLSGSLDVSPVHPIWTKGGWKVFLDTPQHVWPVIRYIERNPGKEGLAPQRWEFVKAYDNWPFHEGHSANSPYARRMRGQG